MRIILVRFRDKYEDLQPRVCKTLLDALNDPKKPLATHCAERRLEPFGHRGLRRAMPAPYR